jgi:large subunit ribosomal protein L25
MSQITLKVEKRETGKQIAKQYRREGKVPGVYYIKGEESIPILSEPLALRPIVFTKETHIISLEMEGEEPKECVLKDITFDPVTDKITHFDLIGLSRGETMNFEVPVVVTGASPGVREGGILQQNIHKLNIKCRPSKLPSKVEVDISELELGSSIYIGSLNLEDVEIEASDETPIVSCIHSRVSKSDLGELEEGAEGAEEGEEGAEGAAEGETPAAESAE